MKRLFFILLFFIPINSNAQNDEWNIYKNFDYWKYPTIAITRNTSLEGHRIRTEITCHGSYLGFKLIYSFPNDSMPIPNQAIVMELDGKNYNFYGNGVFKEQDPVFYSVYTQIWQEYDYDDLYDRKFFKTLLYSDENLIFTLKGNALNIDDYKNLSKQDYYWWTSNNKAIWRSENAAILSKSQPFFAEVTMKNYKKSHDELLTYCQTPFSTYED